MKTSPAFQFYPDSWLSSLSVTLMTPAEEGAYIRLLSHAWLSPDCGLPSDSESLKVLSRLGNSWPRSEDKLRAKFRQDGARLFNDRLLTERTKQDEWRRKSQQGGVRSAEAKLKGGARVVEEWCEPNGNSSSPSSSPSPSPVSTLSSKPLSLSPKNGSSQTHGSRFAFEEIPDEWVQFCGKMCWSLDRINSTFEQFGDYWRGVAGAKGRKADWLATWRGWCRRENEKPPGRSMQLFQPHESATEKAIRIGLERVRETGRL